MVGLKDRNTLDIYLNDLLKVETLKRSLVEGHFEGMCISQVDYSFGWYRIYCVMLKD